MNTDLLPMTREEFISAPDVLRVPAAVQHCAAIAELQAQLVEALFSTIPAEKLRSHLIGPLTEIGVRARAVAGQP